MQVDKAVEGEALLGKALAISQAQNAQNLLFQAVPLQDLSSLSFRRWHFAEAERYSRQALEIYKKEVGPDHSYVVANLRYLAGLRLFQGDYRQAESLYREALTTEEHARGLDTLEVAVCLGRLAFVLEAMGNFQAAEKSQHSGARTPLISSSATPPRFSVPVRLSPSAVNSQTTPGRFPFAVESVTLIVFPSMCAASAGRTAPPRG